MERTSAATREPGLLEAAVALGTGKSLVCTSRGSDAVDREITGLALPLYCLIKPILGLALLCDPTWDRLLDLAGDIGGRRLTIRELLTHRAGLSGAHRWASAFLPVDDRLPTVRHTATFDQGATEDPTGLAYSDIDGWVLAEGILKDHGRSFADLLERARQTHGLGEGVLDRTSTDPVAVDWIESGAYRIPLAFLSSRAWRRDPIVFLNAYVEDATLLLRGIATAFTACRDAGDDRLDAFTNRGRFHAVGFDHTEQYGPREYGIGTMSDGGIHHPELVGLVGHYSWRGTSGLFVDAGNDLVLLSLRLGVEAAIGPQPSVTLPRLGPPEPVDALAARIDALRSIARQGDR